MKFRNNIPALLFVAAATFANDAETHTKRGEELFRQNEFGKAITELNKAIQQDPNNATAYFIRGYAYLNRSEYSQAISDLTQATRLNPNYAVAYNIRGNAYRKKGEHDEGCLGEKCPPKDNEYSEKAIADYTKAIELNPNYAEAYSNRGNMYYRKGNSVKAIADYKTALQLNPNNAEAKEKLEKPTPFTDPRDGKEYKTVKLNWQTWLAENLNYNADGSKCYDNKPENCEKYGRLYNWETALKACPSGWHLPSMDEYKIFAITGGYGYPALPGGLGLSDGGFRHIGNYGFWWMSQESNDDYAYSWGKKLGNIPPNDSTGWTTSHKSNLQSAHCIMDKPQGGTK